MGAPAFDPAALTSAAEKAVESVFTRSGFDPKHLNSIPKNDELSAALKAMEEFADSVASTVDDKIARSNAEKLATGLAAAGFDAEEFTRAWEGMKALDATGMPLSKRDPDGEFSERWRREAYKKVGRGAIASCYLREHQPIPKEWQAEGVQRTQLAGTDTKGGVTIPQLRLEEWDMLMRDNSLAFRLFPVEDMAGETQMIVPTITSDVDTAHLTTEGTTAASETDADFAAEADSKVDCAVMGAWVGISRKIPPQRMANMQGRIGRMLMKAAGVRQDIWVFNGTSPFTTLLSAATGAYTMPVTRNLGNESIFADWLGLQGAVDANHIGRSVYLLHPTVFMHTVGLVDSQNRPLFITGWVAPPGITPNSPVTDGPVHFLLGRPCYLSTAMPTLASATSGTKFGLYFDPEFGHLGQQQAPFLEEDDSLDRSKFLRRLYIFNVFAFKYSQGSAAAYIQTAAS